MRIRTPVAALFLLTLAACHPQAGPAAPSVAQARPAAPATPPGTAPVLPPPDMATPAAKTGTDAWIGKWTGPEGTFLDIESSDTGYQITVRDLDGMKFFAGKRAGDAIEFERAGKTESIHATDGKATGMKWLAGKHECLTIHAGEGFCRR